jgi:hypothetical protein
VATVRREGEEEGEGRGSGAMSKREEARLNCGFMEKSINQDERWKDEERGGRWRDWDGRGDAKMK